MKVKMMALVLAVGLGVTGVAATAQAGVQTANGCAHANATRLREDAERGRYYNGTYHEILCTVHYYCKDCRSEFDETELVGYEVHDYEQIYYDDGSVMSYCTGCDDRFFW